MSSINRISEGKIRDFQPQQLTTQQLQQRISLFTSDSVDRTKAVSTDKGRIVLPEAEPEQQAAMRDLYGNATPEQREKLAQASHALASALTIEGLESAAAGQTITHAQEMYIATQQGATIEEVTTGTFHMALSGSQGEVYGLAMELGAATQNSKDLRSAIADFRTTISEWPEGVETQRFEWYELDDTGKLVHHEADLNKTQAAAKLKNMETALAQVKDVAQDFQLRVQDAMQKQQQIFQMLSNLMKSFHDTAKAVIQNMRG